MNRERVGSYIKRTGLAIFGASVLAMTIENPITGTIANSAHPEVSTLDQKREYEITIQRFESAKKTIAEFLSEADAARLDSAPPYVDAKSKIKEAQERDVNYKNYKEELEGNRPWWYLAGTIGGLSLAAVGNQISLYRRRIVASIQ